MWVSDRITPGIIGHASHGFLQMWFAELIWICRCLSFEGSYIRRDWTPLKTVRLWIMLILGWMYTSSHVCEIHDIRIFNYLCMHFLESLHFDSGTLEFQCGWCVVISMFIFFFLRLTLLLAGDVWQLTGTPFDVCVGPFALATGGSRQSCQEGDGVMAPKLISGAYR